MLLLCPVVVDVAVSCFWLIPQKSKREAVTMVTRQVDVLTSCLHESQSRAACSSVPAPPANLDFFILVTAFCRSD